MKRKLKIASVILIVLSVALLFVGLTIALYYPVQLYSMRITTIEMMNGIRSAAVFWVFGMLTSLSALVVFVIEKVKK